MKSNEVESLRRLFLESMGLSSGRSLDSPSDSLGPYILVEEIGEGAFGRVYRCFHRDLRKDVALKILHPHRADSGEAVARFQREARTAASLDHSNIVRVRDVGVEEDRHFIAMDFIEGQTLDRWIEDDDPSIETRFRLMKKVAHALAHAHGRGVLHRDLKPRNILVRQDGEPFLVDFGLARALDDAQVTKDGDVIGTPSYMSPEQLVGDSESISPRTDVFAFGVLLYEVLLGEPPFDRELSRNARRRRILRGDYVTPSLRVRKLSPHIDDIIIKCLGAAPQSRFQDGSALAAALESESHAATVGRLRRFRWARRALSHRGWITATTLAIALFTLGAAHYFGDSTEPSQASYAVEIHRALRDVGARLGDVVRRAESLRYQENTGAERMALLAEFDRLIQSHEDETGVALAFRGWMECLMFGDPGVSSLATVKTDYPLNPVTCIFQARWKLRLYLDHASWPGESGMNVNAPDPEALAPLETRAIRSHLDEAEKSLRELASWSDVLPDTQWVTDLANGCRSYADGQFEEATAILDLVPRDDGLAFEISMLSALAHCRRGCVEDAIVEITDLVRRRPELIPSKRALSACFRWRGMNRIALGVDGDLEDLKEARLWAVDVSQDVTCDPWIAQVDRAISSAFMRRGDSAASRKSLEQAEHTYAAAVNKHPKDSRLRTNYGALLRDLGRPEPRGGSWLPKSIEQLEIAAELDPKNPIVLSNLIQSHLIRLGSQIDLGNIDPRDVDRLNAWVDTAIESGRFRREVTFCKFGTQLTLYGYESRYGDADTQSLRRILNAMDSFVEAREDSPDIRGLRLFARFSYLSRLPPSSDEIELILEDTRTLIGLFGIDPSALFRGLERVRGHAATVDIRRLDEVAPGLWRGALERLPNRSEFSLGLIRALWRHSNRDESDLLASIDLWMEEIELFLGSFPLSGEGLRYLAWSLETRARIDDDQEGALERIDSAIDIAESNAALWLAKEILESQIGLDGAESHTMLRKLAATEDGKEQLKAMNEDLMDVVTDFGSSELYLEQACAWTDAISQSLPNEGAFAKTRAFALCRVGRPEEAIEVLEELLLTEGFEGDRETFLFLSMSFLDAGDPAQSRKWLSSLNRELDMEKSHRRRWKRLEKIHRELTESLEPNKF